MNEEEKVMEARKEYQFVYDKGYMKGFFHASVTAFVLGALVYFLI